MKNSKASIIESKLTQKPLESKKALYGLLASACVLFVFGISAYIIILHAEAAKEVVELANLVVLFFGALVTTLVTGQACMDWKAMSVLQHTDTSEKIESNEEAPLVQVNQRIPRAKYFDDRILS